MKKSLIILYLIFVSPVFHLAGCPTCVGRIDNESPPFFSEEFYQPAQDSLDSVYEQYLKDQQHGTAEENKLSQKEES